MTQLADIARALVAKGKGILAADESQGTIDKRFKALNIANTETNRRDYREMLFTTPGAAEYTSGVILYDETIRQKSAAGKPFTQILQEQGIIPGIKVDAGAKPLPTSPNEMMTEGLDGLRERLKEYYGMGARFAKWRAVINIDTKNGLPTDRCLHINAHGLARYAALCQEAQIVPIVEPEVIMDGDHSIEACYSATSRALTFLFDELNKQGVALEGTLLKPNMVISGTKCSRQAKTEEIADQTINCFLRHVPAAIPGIVFLSGGQSDEAATENLNTMHVRFKTLPWGLSFSYGRALQAASMSAWAGQARNVDAGKTAFFHRLKLNSAATLGRYTASMEKSV
jgi:fructose-bisphosphate aldolase class I